MGKLVGLVRKGWWEGVYRTIFMLYFITLRMSLVMKLEVVNDDTENVKVFGGLESSVECVRARLHEILQSLLLKKIWMEWGLS